MYVCVCVYTYMYVCVCVCVCVYIYIYICIWERHESTSRTLSHPLQSTRQNVKTYTAPVSVRMHFVCNRQLRHSQSIASRKGLHTRQLFSEYRPVSALLSVGKLYLKPVLNPFTRPTTTHVRQNCCKYRYSRSSCFTENLNLCNSMPSLNARQRSCRENNGSRIGYGNCSVHIQKRAQCVLFGWQTPLTKCDHRSIS